MLGQVGDRRLCKPILQLSRSIEINLLLIYFTILYERMGRSAEV
jgi:hypothetical protein